MSDTIVQLDPADPRWLEYIGLHPDAMIYHHPAWVGMIADCYGFSPTLAAILDGDGGIAAGIPLIDQRSRILGRRLVALPFSDFCPPLARDRASLLALVGGLDRLRRERGVDRLEVRWPLPELAGVHAGEKVLRHTTLLPGDPEELFARFHRTRVQQPVGVAEREGVTVRRGERWEDLLSYYALHLRTRKRLGSPVQPIRFFRLLWERILSPGLGSLLLSYSGGRVVAGGIFLRWGDTVVYKFNASDPVYWPIAPNHALLWEAMREGCAEGYHLFDWGKTEIQHHGLRDFKRGWGSREEILNVSVISDLPPVAGNSGPAKKMLVHVIKRSPLWVCRVIGELTYGQLG